MKRIHITTAVTCLVTLLLFSWVAFNRGGRGQADSITVGFIYEDDESTPYTYNFALAEEAVREAYGSQVRTISRSNVPENEMEEPLRELVRQDCAIIFTNSHSAQFSALAEEFPDVQFCQVSYLEDQTANVSANYHTFKGEIWQGRYVSGIAAGMKLKELLDMGQLTEDEALAGYVAASPTQEVVSGYTAFLEGMRSIVPGVELQVKYTDTWGSYSKEKECARELLEEGCVILSQHSDTIGPAVACEESPAQRPVIFIGYNQSMLDVAPTTALVSTRINWAPYIVGAMDAVRRGLPIEESVSGNVSGNEITAGFDLGWVEMLELNTLLAAEGTQEAMTQAIEALKKSSVPYEN